MSCNWLLRFFLTQLWIKLTRIKPVKLFGLSKYAISGLGADKRVFKFLKLQHELIPLEWIPTKNKESIITYAKRMIAYYEIDSKSDFGILGVSFGGLIATEMSKLLKPKFTVLISSVETRNELSRTIKLFGKSKLLELIPRQLLNPPKFVSHYLFGTNEKQLLNNILNDTDLVFTKWAIRELINWKNEERLPNLIKIGGAYDKLLPPKGEKMIIIKGGEHFMIVDKAEEISLVINKEVNKVIVN